VLCVLLFKDFFHFDAADNTKALRLSYGSIQLSPRVAYTPLMYDTFVIPARTPVSMNFYAAHHDERVFPDSHSFLPERWLKNPTVSAPDTSDAFVTEGASEKSRPTTPMRTKQLSRYMVVFGKGSRQCIGMELAWAELYLLLANLIRRCDFDIFETEWRDVGFVREFGGPFPASDARGLRVLVKDVV
jgi:cytochrome P450